jgi:WD40 repeat protein
LGKVTRTTQTPDDERLHPSLWRNTWITAVVIAADNRTALVGTHEGDVVVWDLATNGERTRFRCGNRLVTALAVTPDNQYVVAAALDTEQSSSITVKVWDLQTGSEALVIKGRRTSGSGFGWFPDAGAVRALGLLDEFARRLRAAQGSLPGTAELAQAAEWGIRLSFSADSAITPDGRYEATFQRDDASTNAPGVLLTVIDRANGSERSSRAPLPSGKELQHVLGTAISADGRWGLSVWAPGGVTTVWDLEQLRPVYEDDFQAYWGKVSLSGDGSIVAVCLGHLSLWDTRTGKVIARFVGDSPSFDRCAVSSHGSVVLLGEQPGYLHVLRLEGHSGACSPPPQGRGNAIP